MKHILALGVALCAAALFAPVSQAQILYVGSNSSGVSSNFTSGTNSYSATYVGYDVGANSNSLSVINTNTVLTSSGVLRVGESGSSNSMVISNGGKVTHLSGYIGFNSTASNNSVLVTGANSLWTNAADVVVGNFGSGNSLVISDGGKIQDDFVYIGNVGTSSNNSVLVTGTNSLWTNIRGFTVGNDGSGNSLVISDGGRVQNANGFIGRTSATSSNNSVLVTGGTSLWTNSGTLAVGNSGAGNSLTISNGGRVQNTGGTIGSTSTASNNSALVTGAGSTWSNSSTLTVGNSGSGTLTVANGGSVAATGITIAASITSAGTLNIGRFGTNDTAGTISAPTIAFGTGTGTINFNQSDSLTLTSRISGAGKLKQLGTGMTTLSASNSYTGATTVAAGQLVVDGSIAASAVTVQSGGTLGGSGKVGATTIQSGATISPGNSPGNLTVQGNLVWNGGGNYNWQVLGTTNTAGFAAGVTWDLLTVNGTLDLTALTQESKFNINLWSLASIAPDVSGNIADFSATGSYEWLAVVASNITGFDAADFNVRLTATNGTDGFSNPIEPTGTFSVRQDGGNLYVTYGVVPEPSTYALLALAGGAAFMRWRKRAKNS